MPRIVNPAAYGWRHGSTHWDDACVDTWFLNEGDLGSLLFSSERLSELLEAAAEGLAAAASRGLVELRLASLTKERSEGGVWDYLVLAQGNGLLAALKGGAAFVTGKAILTIEFELAVDVRLPGGLGQRSAYCSLHVLLPDSPSYEAPVELAWASEAWSLTCVDNRRAILLAYLASEDLLQLGPEGIVEAPALAAETDVLAIAAAVRERGGLTVDRSGLEFARQCSLVLCEDEPFRLRNNEELSARNQGRIAEFVAGFGGAATWKAAHPCELELIE